MVQCTVMAATALVGVLAVVSGVNASPVQAPAAAVEDRTAWMFKYCTETDLGGKCAQKADDGNLSVCGKFSSPPPVAPQTGFSVQNGVDNDSLRFGCS